MNKDTVTDVLLFLNDASSYALVHWLNTHLYEIDQSFAQWHNNTLRIGDEVAHPGDYIAMMGDGSFRVLGKGSVIFIPKLD